MSDLRSKLAAALGQAPPPDESAAGPAAEPAADAPSLGILAPDAHLGSDWLNRLQELRRKVPGAPDLGTSPKLGQAEQVGNQVHKLLKKAGRKREAMELRDLQHAFFARREKAAWAALKLRFAELGLPEKTYRALKQGEIQPLQALARLEKAEATELQGMGHARLKELLGG